MIFIYVILTKLECLSGAAVLNNRPISGADGWGISFYNLYKAVIAYTCDDVICVNDILLLPKEEMIIILIVMDMFRVSLSVS